MFFHVSDEDSPPSTPRDINTLTNPFSPSAMSPRGEDMFSATFDAHFPQPESTNDINLPANDPFDPFSANATPKQSGNLGNDLDFFGGTPVIQPQHPDNSVIRNNDDLFGGFDTSGISVFDVSASQNNDSNLTPNTPQQQQQQQQQQYHDFDAFGVSSTSAADFGPKTDPFADTPDWESVASEEVGGSSVSSVPHNPFSSGSGNLTTKQNVDLFNASTTTTNATTTSQNGHDPFGSINQNSDPFGSPNQNSDPFGSTNQNSHPFGSTNHNSDPFGSSNVEPINPFGSANQSADMFGSTNQNMDPFGNTSSTPNMQNSLLFSTNNNLDTFGSANQQHSVNNTMSPNPFASQNDLSSATTTSQGASPDIFSDYLNNKVAARDINNAEVENPFNQQQQMALSTPSNHTNDITSFEDDFPSFTEQMTNMNLNEHHENDNNIDFTMTQDSSTSAASVSCFS